MNSTWLSQYTRKYHYYKYVQTCVPRNKNYEKWLAGESPVIVRPPKCLSIWGLLYMLFGEGYRSPGDCPVLCGQDIRAALHPGLSGETSHVPFPSVPASWTRGNNCLHKSSLLARIACLPCPSWTGEPAQTISCLETGLQLHDQQLWQHYSYSNHPPTYRWAVVFRLVYGLWKKIKKLIYEDFYQSPLVVTLQSLHFFCLSHQEVLEENAFCSLFGAGKF